jgi:hypothetical protein
MIPITFGTYKYSNEAEGDSSLAQIASLIQTQQRSPLKGNDIAASFSVFDVSGVSHPHCPILRFLLALDEHTSWLHPSNLETADLERNRSLSLSGARIN